MSYQVTQEHGYAVVHLAGDIDLSCSPEVRRLLLEQLGAARPTLVDMAAVTYIDSSGIASLVEAYQTARKKHLEFGLVAVSDAARSVLELARLDKVFRIHAALTDLEQR
jgi:anti-sigma B factor antagonist